MCTVCVTSIFGSLHFAHTVEVQCLFFALISLPQVQSVLSHTLPWACFTIRKKKQETGRNKHTLHTDTDIIMFILYLCLY